MSMLQDKLIVTHGSQVELARVKATRNRIKYYTDVSLKLDDEYMTFSMRIDTGAAYTLIGLDNKNLKHYKNEIMSKGEIEPASGIMIGSNFDVYKYVVEDFELGDAPNKVIFPKIKVSFSDKIKDIAVLGMDILSLFDFKYIRDKHSSNGTFTLFGFDRTKEILEKHDLNNNINYLDPHLVALIDDKKIHWEINQSN